MHILLHLNHTLINKIVKNSRETILYSSGVDLIACIEGTPQIFNFINPNDPSRSLTNQKHSLLSVCMWRGSRSWKEQKTYKQWFNGGLMTIFFQESEFTFCYFLYFPVSPTSRSQKGGLSSKQCSCIQIKKRRKESLSSVYFMRQFIVFPESPG